MGDRWELTRREGRTREGGSSDRVQCTETGVQGRGGLVAMGSSGRKAQGGALGQEGLRCRGVLESPGALGRATEMNQTPPQSDT